MGGLTGDFDVGNTVMIEKVQFFSRVGYFLFYCSVFICRLLWILNGRVSFVVYFE